MKQEAMKERVELLEIGERLGYPRLGYGRSTKIPHDRRIPPGKVEWEKFAAHAHVRRLLPALRIGRVLRDNNVAPFHPLSGAEVAPPIAAPVFRDGDALQVLGTFGPTTDILDEIDVPAPPRAPRPGQYVEPGTVKVYPAGKRRKYPSKKNKKKDG